jgi:GDP-4-dehydro-6-deoxy-D-mannose reductase
MRILLTGASGFVGRHLFRGLRRAFPEAEILALGGSGSVDLDGHRVVGIDLSSQSDDLIKITDFAPEIVIHLAAISSVGNASLLARSTMRTNLVGTTNLLCALEKAATYPAIIFASSGEVYGDSFLAGAADETFCLHPKNAYARSKVACEYALTDMAGRSAPLVILRLFNHTGPGQDERFVASSFAAQIARIVEGGVPPVLSVGNLDAQRDFMSVHDVVKAYISVVREVRRLDAACHVFNVCSGKPVSIRTVLDTLLSLSDQEILVTADPARMRPSDIPIAAGVAKAFEAKFGWEPEIELRASLVELFAYWQRTVREAKPT